MQVVVTGGAGFIGSWVVRRLRERGDRVTVLDIVAPEPAAGEDGEITAVKGSVLDPDVVHEATRGADAVVHLAGLVRAGVRRQPYLGASLQLQGTLNVLEACRANGVGRLGYASSFYVYDGLAAERSVDEDTPLDPQVMELFGAAKYMGELLCAEYARQGGLAVTAYRIGPAYGGAGSSALDEFIASGLRGQTVEIWGSGQRRNQYTQVVDVAEAIVVGLDHGAGIYNVTSPEAVRLRDVAELLRDYEIKANFDSSRPEGPSLPYIRSERAVADWGWRPAPLAEGLRQAVEALAAGGRL